MLAHPGQQNNFALLPKLVEAGLKGIEYNHPSHHEEHRRKVREEAEKFGLFMTGGSDFHGLLPKLVEAGLKGIEYNHPSHHEEHRRKVREEAEKFGLFMTGGSDFHGLYEKTKTTLGAYPAHESSKVLFEKKF